MRTFFGQLLLLVLLPGMAFAQLTDIQIDSSSIPGNEIDQVYIDQSTGQLVITTNSGYEVSKVLVGGDVTITSFTVGNKSTLALATGDTATVKWSTVNASDCSASTTPSGALTNWGPATQIGVSGSKSVTFPQAGMFILTLNCNGSVGGPVSKNVTVTVGGVDITTFNATPAKVVSGSDAVITLAWSTENAILCHGSGNWPNSTDLSLPSGTQQISLTNMTADISYTLTCAGEAQGDEVSRSAVVRVESAAANCENVSLKSGVSSRWGDIFRNDWPGPASQTVDTTVAETGYLAIKFDTGAVKDHGTLATIERPGTSGGRLGAVSRCAGDFDVPASCRFFWGFSGGIVWATDGRAGACQLDANTTYYWNVTFTDGVDPGTSSCAGTFCETSVRVSNLDYVAP